jgi:hypothetical protein
METQRAQRGYGEHRAGLFKPGALCGEKGTMIRLYKSLSAMVLGLSAVCLLPALSRAQEVAGDHRRAASMPLFVQDLPIGTISVRMTRPSMSEPIRDTPVSGSWTTRDGKKDSRIVKTGDDGRAIFSGIPVGSTFQGHAVVEGQDLSTAEFPVPDEGGTRLLLIVGKDAQETMETMGQMTGNPHAGMAAKAMVPSVRSGKVEPRSDLPAGCVDILVLDAEGKPVVGAAVDLQPAKPHPNQGKDVGIAHAIADASGTAHFTDVKAGEGVSYQAEMERDGLRLGSVAFTPDPKHGSAGELRIPSRTNDLSVLKIASGSRMMVEPREDTIGILQNLMVENTSDKIFDPGPRGLLIPLPDGFTGFEALPGGPDLDIKEGEGVFLRAPLPPSSSSSSVVQVSLGYVLPTHGKAEFEIVQPMPIGMEGGLVMLPSESPIRLSAPGLRSQPAQRDDEGNELLLYDLDTLPPGQALHLTVHNLPTRDRTGKTIAGVLVGLLVIAGIRGARRQRGKRAV